MNFISDLIRAFFRTASQEHPLQKTIIKTLHIDKRLRHMTPATTVKTYFALLIFATALSGALPASAAPPPAREHTPKSAFKLPFFDGIKLQTTNSNPKLTNANHMIEDVNRLTGSGLRDWDTLIIQTVDIVLWKDLSKYFKADIAVAGSTGSLISSSKGFRGTPLEIGIRMRQRYSALALWTNIYFFPLTTNYKKQSKSGHTIEPFISAGLGHTFFRSESVFKLRKGRAFYNRIKNNWYGSAWAYKIMTGFNVNLENITPRLTGWIITVSAFQIWNRLKGRSSMHLTDGMQLGGRAVNAGLRVSNRMDIDLSGPHFSFAIGRSF